MPKLYGSEVRQPDPVTDFASGVKQAGKARITLALVSSSGMNVFDLQHCARDYSTDTMMVSRVLFVSLMRVPRKRCAVNVFRALHWHYAC
jgi:hypothetical protein